MKLEIADGAGKGLSAEVDSNLRLQVKAVTVSASATSTAIGDSYNINTSLFTVTTANESGLLYIKNGEDQDLHIHTVVVILGPSTGGLTSDTTRVRFYRNPTTGTLISDANTTNVINENRNFGSSNTLDATLVYNAAATDETITDGAVMIESLINPGSRVAFNIDLTLTKGKSIAVSIEPNNSNTSMKTMIAAVCHLENGEG